MSHISPTSSLCYTIRMEKYIALIIGVNVVSLLAAYILGVRSQTQSFKSAIQSLTEKRTHITSPSQRQALKRSIQALQQ